MAHIAVFIGSVRVNRHADKVAHWVERALKERGHTVTVVDPLEYDELLVMKRMFTSEKKPNEKWSVLRNSIISADGYVLVTPEYNHSYSGAIKNALDVFLEEYYFKPFSIISYSAGGFGGIRAAEHLRAVISELGGVSTPIALSISRVQELFSDDGSLKDSSYTSRLEKMLGEFEWYVAALKSARKKGVPY